MEKYNKDHKCDGDMMCCTKAMCLKGVIMLAICFVATKLLWDWIVPDIFVTGIISPTISWYTAFKLALVCTAIMIMKKKQKHMMMMHMKNIK